MLHLQYKHAFLPIQTPAETLTLANRLGLAKLYKELLGFEWGGDTSDMAAALLAASLPNMETCHVGMFQEGIGAFDHLIQYLTLCGKSLERLRNLTLANSNSDIYDPYSEDAFHHLCALPSLVRLHIQGIYFDGISDEGPQPLGLEYLHMDEYCYNFDRGHHKRLEPLKSLKHLRLHIPDARIEMDVEHCPRYIENLYFLENSLETLELLTNEPYCASDGTIFELAILPPQPTLRSFHRLKNLALTDMCMVGVTVGGPFVWPHDAAPVLEHLKWMLPSSLETLTHLVRNGPMVSNDEWSLQEYRSRWSNTWATATPDMFSKLKVVMVQMYGLNGLDKERKIV